MDQTVPLTTEMIVDDLEWTVYDFKRLNKTIERLAINPTFHTLIDKHTDLYEDLSVHYYFKFQPKNKGFFLALNAFQVKTELHFHLGHVSRPAYRAMNRGKELIKLLVFPEAIETPSLRPFWYSRIDSEHWKVIPYDKPQYSMVFFAASQNKRHWKSFMLIMIASKGLYRPFTALSEYYMRAQVDCVKDALHEDEFIDLIILQGSFTEESK